MRETKSSAEGLGYSVEKYEESPGLYYELLGEATLYNTEWKTIVYVNLQQTDRETGQLGQYIGYINKLCQATEVQNWTDCNHFSTLSKDRFKQIKGTEKLLNELIGNSGHIRKRRGALNFVGEISKILFGTLDSDDADYYNEQIKHFEEETQDITGLMNQQLSIIKTSLGTVNSTISDMEYNNQVIKEGVSSLKSYLERFSSETETQLNILSVKVTVEGHIARANSALDAMQRNLDLMIESVLNAQKGILQPQIVPANLLMETLRKSASVFPKDTMAPFAFSKDSFSWISKVCDIHIYIKEGILSYIISLPLISRGTFKVFRLIPLPVGVEKDKFVYLETNKELLYVDQTRQYYFATSREDLRRCKSTELNSYICKQSQPLLNSHMQESCEIKLLQPRLNIPKVCDTRIVKIVNTIWTQLEKGNEWIYFIPSSESITILCPEKEPVDIVLRGTGKLSIQSGCKGYSLTAMLATQKNIQVNNSRHGGDLLSKVESHFDCCEQFGTSINLSHIELDMKLKHVVTHMEDLKFASYKISELENLSKEEEWKWKHLQYHKTYSVLMYISLTIIILYGLYRLIKFIVTRCRNSKALRAIAAKAECLSLPAEASGTGNVININIKTSNESLSRSSEAIPLRDIEDGARRDSTPDLRRSKRGKANKSYF
jgi:hypothetical protein